MCGLLRDGRENKWGRPAPFVTPRRIGKENNRTNNRAMDASPENNRGRPHPGPMK